MKIHSMNYKKTNNLRRLSLKNLVFIRINLEEYMKNKVKKRFLPAIIISTTNYF